MPWSALVSEEQCRSLIGDEAALLNALANERCKNGALSNIMLGQAMKGFARKRLQDELARVCSHVSFLENPLPPPELLTWSDRLRRRL